MDDRRTVGSLFINMERLAGRAELLAGRWTFAFPAELHRETLTEFSLPLHPEGFVTVLARRTGLRIEECSAEGLYDTLAKGRSIIAAVDSFYLPYRPAFGRVHSHRTIIVHGVHSSGVEIEDVWPPSYRGVVERGTFERARYSEVPLDPEREPIFAGRPIAGEWYLVSKPVAAPVDRFEWAADLLGQLHAEAERDIDVAGVSYGPRAMSAFVDAVASGSIDARAASLLMRAELGARVYLCALLRLAAKWVADPSLLATAVWYSNMLRAMELARDVLTKSLAHPTPRLFGFVLNQLREASETEHLLVERLAPWSHTSADTRVA